MKRGLREYRVNWPEKYASGEHWAVQDWCRQLYTKALRLGWIIRRSCEVCGESNYTAGHHHNYHEPYSVHFLCPRHHKIADRLRKMGEPYSRSVIAELGGMVNK
jgi:hypothetical protein